MTDWGDSVRRALAAEGTPQLAEPRVVYEYERKTAHDRAALTIGDGVRFIFGVALGLGLLWVAVLLLPWIGLAILGILFAK